MSVTNLVWLLAVLMLIGWLLGGFVFNVGGIIHILLVLIVLAVLYNLITGRRVA